jgi:hypothetical protein
MSCAVGQQCNCPKHDIPTALSTTRVKLTCACGYVTTSRSGVVACDNLRDHCAYSGCPTTL